MTTLNLTPEEINVLNLVLETVQKCVDIIGLEAWGTGEPDQEHILDSIIQKVKDLK